MTNPAATNQIQLPLLPLRGIVLFPEMKSPIFVGRLKSKSAVTAAMEQVARIMVVAQKAAAKDEPSAEDFFDVGCIANILQMIELPDGTLKITIEGSQRARICHVSELGTYFVADVTPVESTADNESDIEAMCRAAFLQFEQCAKLYKKFPPELLTSLARMDDAGSIADMIAISLPLELEQKQTILESFDVSKRYEQLLRQLKDKLDNLNQTNSMPKWGGWSRNADCLIQEPSICENPVTTELAGFPMDTLVLTLYGNMEIQFVEVGTMVLSGCEKTGEINYRPVTKTFERHVSTLCEIRFNYDDGYRSAIDVAPEHPFWISGIGWRRADKLQSGDRLVIYEDFDKSRLPEQYFDRKWVAPPKDPNGDSLVTVVSSNAITALSWVGLEEVPVYNFEVADFHTYFMGDSGIWVHNDNCPDQYR